MDHDNVSSLIILFPFVYRHCAHSVKTPALRTVGNILSGDDLHTQLMINLSVLPCLLSLLGCPKQTIRKEACWAISNITAGNRCQIQAVIDCNIIPALINLINSADYDAKKDALWAISNATSGGSPEQIRYMVEQGCIRSLCDLLTVSDASLVAVALEALENVLKAGKMDSHTPSNVAGATGRNPYADEVEAVDGLDKIEQLLVHRNICIHKKAVEIEQNYFGEDDYDAINVVVVVGDDDDADDGAPFAFGALSAALPKEETPHRHPQPSSI